MFNKEDKIIKEGPTPSPYLALFYINKRETNMQQKLQKTGQSYSKERRKQRDYLKETRRAYSKERRKQQDYLKNEVTRLDKLLEKGSINEDLHTRYKKILEIDYSKKRLETREKYGFKTHLHKL